MRKIASSEKHLKNILREWKASAEILEEESVTENESVEHYYVFSA